MRFFKNASRTEVVQGWKNKSHIQSWEGAPPKKDPLTVKKKSRGRVKKTKKYSTFDVLVPEMKKVVICVFTVEHTDMKLNVNARGSVKRHQTNNSAFFLFVLFLSRPLQQVFF